MIHSNASEVDWRILSIGETVSLPGGCLFRLPDLRGLVADGSELPSINRCGVDPLVEKAKQDLVQDLGMVFAAEFTGDQAALI